MLVIKRHNGDIMTVFAVQGGWLYVACNEPAHPVLDSIGWVRPMDVLLWLAGECWMCVPF